MLAVRLHGNRDLRVDEMPEPDSVGPGQLRVMPQWCGICGTDLHEYSHGPLYTPAEQLPQVIGHEFSAVVAETGAGVRDLQAGDRVAVLPHVFCGSCYYCLRGRQGLCSSLWLTGMALRRPSIPAQPTWPSRCSSAPVASAPTAPSSAREVRPGSTPASPPCAGPRRSPSSRCIWATGRCSRKDGSGAT